MSMQKYWEAADEWENERDSFCPCEWTKNKSAYFSPAGGTYDCGCGEAQREPEKESCCGCGEEKDEYDCGCRKEKPQKPCCGCKKAPCRCGKKTECSSCAEKYRASFLQIDCPCEEGCKSSAPLVCKCSKKEPLCPLFRCE